MDVTRTSSDIIYQVFQKENILILQHVKANYDTTKFLLSIYSVCFGLKKIILVILLSLSQNISRGSSVESLLGGYDFVEVKYSKLCKVSGFII